MSTTPALVAKPKDERPTIFEMQPKEMVKYAAGVASQLKDVIENQQLCSDIQGKKYVHVEGWTTLGTMLGCLPREVAVRELPDGSYEAKVELFNIHSGQVVGGASALCGMDERRWRTAERFARRSMSITRATGKAYRLGFSWIMTLAGYEATPFEEMPETVRHADNRSAAPASRSEAPRETSGAAGDYVPNFGKFRGRPLSSQDVSDLEGYCNWLRNDSAVKRKPLSQNAIEFIDAVTAYRDELLGKTMDAEMIDTPPPHITEDIPF